MEETIHISFKEKKQDLNQNLRDLEDGLEDLSLNDNSQNQSSLQITIRNGNEEMGNNPKSSLPHHVSDDILENSEASYMRKRYTGARDLRAISQNQVIGEPSQEIKTKSSFIAKSNMALIFETQPKCIDEAFPDQSCNTLINPYYA